MAGRAFRLAAVLRVREIQERHAKGEVGLAQQQVLSAQQEAAQRLVMAQRWRPTPGVSVEQFRAELAHGLALSANVATAQAALTAAREVLSQRQADWQHAKQRVKPLERLAEHHAEAVHAAEVKTDQAAADEVAATRWRRG